MRSIYYHLKKGVEIGEIKVNTIKSEKGDYSWGCEAEKIYYSIGEKAIPKMDNKVKEYLDAKETIKKE